MAIRLEQMHPALVHLPIALLPFAVIADVLGTLTAKRSLHTLGKQAIVAAAAGAAASAVTGLIAGEEVNVEGASRDKLMTHRNLNAAVTIIASCMAAWRSTREEPNDIYLGAGLLGMGVLSYTAYLGGQLVYDSGVGVGPAHGVYRPDAPTLRSDQMSEFISAAGTDLAHGVKHMAQELREGYIVPAIAGKKNPNRDDASIEQSTNAP
jgi:uncharacterized membrane protein